MSSEKNNAVQANVSREDLKNEFFQRIEDAKAHTFETPSIFNYHGERGSGKSWFGGELKREARDKGYTVLELDLSSEKMEPEEALEGLMRGLKEKKINSWRCGVVMRQLEKNWDEELQRRWTVPIYLSAFILVVAINLLLLKVTQGGILVVTVVANTLLSVIDVKPVKETVRKFILRNKQKRADRKFEKEEKKTWPCEPDIQGLGDGRKSSLKKGDEAKKWNQSEKKEALKRLPELFAKDVNDWLKKHPGEILCVFIDSYDARKNGDEWLCGKHGLCLNLKHAIFAIIGEKLSWEDEELRNALVCHEFGRLDLEKTRNFLEQRGVPDVLRETLYQHTDGWPELLDKWCEMYSPGDKKNDWQENRNGKLTEEQSKKLKKWVKEFIEGHCHVELSELVYLMARMRRWTTELLERAMWASGIEINDDVEDIMKELSAEGLIARERAGVYSMNESIINILIRNTMLEPQQRENAYMALMEANTASGAEAAYYLGEEDLWSGEENLWSKELAKQLEYHARYSANTAKEQTHKPDDAKQKDFWKRHEEEKQSEQQQKKWLASCKRIDGLLEKAIKVYDRVGKNDFSKLIAMNKRSMYCRFLGRYDEAFALAERVLEESKVLEKSKGWDGLEKTKEYAQKNKDLAQKIMEAAARRAASREADGMPAAEARR